MQSSLVYAIESRFFDRVSFFNRGGGWGVGGKGGGDINFRVTKSQYWIIKILKY